MNGFTIKLLLVMSILLDALWRRKVPAVSCVCREGIRRILRRIRRVSTRTSARSSYYREERLDCVLRRARRLPRKESQSSEVSYVL